ncbi:uncharacterized protein N7459_000503 [Penicillium hispanicum]|uniref:uncharacterized protein n=1 Tax=Penicillium hispanicum TaxID=1080232 RepID=UPI0025423AB6|nr:uncharacterized protein N7459_000503 [Penicillium hispanicum]KAJ5594295.1 hypothetical protein N7459_000503 [Penicillium hispanicum]
MNPTFSTITMSSSGPLPSFPGSLLLEAAWPQWESLAINLAGIPKEANTYVLWEAFQNEGTVFSIDIFDDSHGNRSNKGRIRFKPPPAAAFWERGPYRVPLLSGRVAAISLTIEGKGSQNPIINSPIRPELQYPSEIKLDVARIEMGVRIQDSTIHFMHTLDKAASPHLVLNVPMRALFLYFQIAIEGTQSTEQGASAPKSLFRQKIGFHQLGKIWELYDSNTQELSFLTIMDSPAIYHRQVKDIMSTFTGGRSWREPDTWYRQTGLTHNPSLQKKLPTNLCKREQIVDLGRWNVLKITFPPEEVNQQVARDIHAVLQDYNITVKDGASFKESVVAPVPVWEWINYNAKRHADLPFSGTALSSMLGELTDPDHVSLPFSIRYQLEVCISHGYLSEFTMGRDFVVKLLALGETMARRLLEHVATHKKVYLNAMEIFEIKFPKGVLDSKIPSYCCFMRTARITPTTVYYNTPTVDISNRVTRRYAQYSDHFLRVRFTDEKTVGRIRSAINNTEDELFTRVKNTLANGITIGNRHYEFLAFGNSQFREHGAYFFASFPGLTAADIRAWMGQFNHIRNIAKYAARLGQCFSTTRAVTGCPVEVQKIADITRNGHVFSDGVGKISKFLAEMIMSELSIKSPTSTHPSAFQFRLGGCKGMLVVSPDPEPKQVLIRPSQLKFETVHGGLEVIRWSQYSLATLNRQLILVLSALGISDAIFHRKLNNMLTSFDNAMSNDARATSLLQTFVDPNQVTLKLSEMVSAGFRQANEPFVMSMLGLWKAWHLKGLKEKAKIVIDQGANLLGCLDETGTLKGHSNHDSPDRDTRDAKIAALPEIFVQICRAEKGGALEVIEGICILARNPSLHPGDIRVVRAVDRPELRHLIDVVVFPQTGDADIPGMCSGGDLDGDDYLVIWDPDLIPSNWFTNPMKYTSRKGPDLDHNVTVDEITSFFVMYMKNDCLPRIAHAHMAWADWLAHGVTEKKCLRLAQLHSDAVDYNKTGGVAVMTRDLEPRRWPHFMEKKNKRPDQIYHSRKILGQLYDKVENIDFTPNLSMPFDSRILNCGFVALSEPYMEWAANLKSDYDAAMRRVMAQYEIRTEFEVWSTFVLSHNYLCRDYKIHEDLGRISSTLRQGFRQQCYDKVDSRAFDQVAPVAVALYRVTHMELTDALLRASEDEPGDCYDDKDSLYGDSEEFHMPLISFPWIFHEFLGKIALGQYQTPPQSTEERPSQANSKIYTQSEIKKVIAEIEEADLLAAREKDNSHPAEQTISPAFDDSPLSQNKTNQTISDTEADIQGENQLRVASKSMVMDDKKGERKDAVEMNGDVVENESDDDSEVEDIVEEESDLKPSQLDRLMELLGE